MSEELASDEISANTIDGSPAKAKPVGPTIPAPAAPRSPAAVLGTAGQGTPVRQSDSPRPRVPPPPPPPPPPPSLPPRLQHASSSEIGRTLVPVPAARSGIQREAGLLELGTPLAVDTAEPTASPTSPLKWCPLSWLRRTTGHLGEPVLVLQLAVESLRRKGLLLRKPSTCIIVHACVTDEKHPPPFTPSLSSHNTPASDGEDVPAPETGAPAVVDPYLRQCPAWPVWLGGIPANAPSWREVGRTEAVISSVEPEYVVNIIVPIQEGDVALTELDARPRMTWLRFSLVEVVDEHSRQAPVETLPLIGVTSCRLVELMPTPRLNLGASSFDRIELHSSMPMLEEGVLSSFLSVASTGGSMRMSLKGRPILHVHSCLPSPLSQLPSRNTLPLFRLSLTVNRGVYAMHAVEYMEETRYGLSVPKAFIHFRTNRLAMAMTNQRRPASGAPVPTMDVRPPMTASVEYERMYTCLKSAGCALTLGSRLPWLVSALAEWLELSSAVHAGVNVLFRLEEYLPARQAELLLQRANTAMEQLTEYLTTCDGPQTDRGVDASEATSTTSMFKKSTLKTDERFRFVPVNCHVQLLRAQAYSVVESSTESLRTLSAEESPTSHRRRSVSMSAIGHSSATSTAGDPTKPLRFVKRLVESHLRQSAVCNLVTVSMGAPVAHKEPCCSDGILQACQAYAAALRASTPGNETDILQLKCDILTRGDVIASQILSALVASFTAAAMLTIPPPESTSLSHAAHQFWYQLESCGYLFEMESWLSTTGADLIMLNDAVFASHVLHRVKLRLVNCTTDGDWAGGDNVRIQQLEQSWVVDLRLDMSTVWPLLPKRLAAGGFIDVIPVLCSQGVNEFQTGANLSGSNRLQCIVNVGALHTLCQYALNASPYETTTSSVDAATTAAWSVIASDGTDAVATGGAGVARIASFRRKSGHAPKTKATAVVDLSVFLPLKTSVASLLKSAIECIADRRMEFEKNVAFMEKASGVVRALRGGKAVFCKSGKDRTGMAVTMEEASCLHRNMDVSDSVPLMDVLRACGARRMNVFKNLDKCTYAFNVVQVSQLPAVFRPPKGTARGGAT